jgi:hypothetical protein
MAMKATYSTCGCCASSTAMPRSSPEPGSPFIDAERWRRVEQLFHAAQPLTPRGHHATGARPTVHLLSVARRSWRHLGRGRDRGFVATMSRRRAAIGTHRSRLVDGQPRGVPPIRETSRTQFEQRRLRRSLRECRGAPKGVRKARHSGPKSVVRKGGFEPPLDCSN